MATSDASIMTLRGAFGLGCTRSVALASASLMSLKAAVAGGVHCSTRLLIAVVFNSEFSGVRIAAHLGVNLW